MHLATCRAGDRTCVAGQDRRFKGALTFRRGRVAPLLRATERADERGRSEGEHLQKKNCSDRPTTRLTISGGLLTALGSFDEVIVVDSGSDDATERIAREFPNVRWLTRPLILIHGSGTSLSIRRRPIGYCRSIPTTRSVLTSLVNSKTSMRAHRSLRTPASATSSWFPSA